MGKAEYLALFIKREVKEQSDQLLEDLLHYINENRAELIAELAQTYERACEKYQQHKAEEQNAKIRFVQYSWIRTFALQRKPFYYLELFGESFYMGGFLEWEAVKMDWIYQRFFEFADRIKEGSQKYILQISQPEIDLIVMAELKKLEKIWNHLLEQAVFPLIRIRKYKQLEDDQVSFQAGEYRDRFQLLFTKNETTNQLGERIDELL